jgi:hypothetical protein
MSVGLARPGFLYIKFMPAIKLSRCLFLFLLVFVLSGCQQTNLSGGLKMLDENLGKVFDNSEDGQSNSFLDIFNKKNSVGTTTPSASLSAAQKESIDAWLEKKGLNKYGDAKNAIYTGGTPLFDEKTGQALERYDYILNKFPDILERIKKEK